MSHRIDIIGDVHGQLPALEKLAVELGYDVSRQWQSSQGRVLVFLGDLIDRGRFSLEVAELVKSLVAEGRAVCLMGNHEYNLIAYHLRVPGYTEPKPSNRETIADLERRPERWQPVLEWLRGLPLAIDLPDLRLVHACWPPAALAAVQPLLGLELPSAAGADDDEDGDTAAWLAAHTVLRSPFEGAGLLPGLPGDTADRDADIPHESFIKGPEVPAKVPYTDADGKRRTTERLCWWHDEEDSPAAHDKLQVFGHYWHLPPMLGHYTPPYPSGTREQWRWLEQVAPLVPAFGKVPLLGEHACVDFAGYALTSTKRACVGGLRWPEREVVWAVASQRQRPFGLG